MGRAPYQPSSFVHMTHMLYLEGQRALSSLRSSKSRVNYWRELYELFGIKCSPQCCTMSELSPWDKVQGTCLVRFRRVPTEYGTVWTYDKPYLLI